MIKLKRLKKIVSHKDLVRWVFWLNDPEVTKYSVQRFKKHTLNSQKRFISKKIKDKSCYLFQIKFKNKFIGVIEIYFHQALNSQCEISYMIGEKKMHGKGLGTKAIKECLKFAKDELNVITVYAGINSKNIQSNKVLRKNFFIKARVNDKYFLIKKMNTNNSILFKKKL